MNEQKLREAVEEAFKDEPTDGYRPFVIAVYSLKESHARFGSEPTGRVSVFLRPSIAHGQSTVFDMGRALFQWIRESIESGA